MKSFYYIKKKKKLKLKLKLYIQESRLLNSTKHVDKIDKRYSRYYKREI